VFSSLRSVYRQTPVLREFKQALAEIQKLQQIGDLQLQAQLALFTSHLLEQDRYRHPKSLKRFERQVFSQSGEDGIIAEIFNRIGVAAKTCVEIGCGHGLESNTAFLLLQGWTGYWFDGDQVAIDFIQREFRGPVSEGRLTARQAFITAENAAETLREAHVPREVDLFSLDIDRNTYWIWEALQELRPRVVVMEYNANIPAGIDWKVEYAPDRVWDGTVYYGASLKAYELLGRRLGYSLVGCSLDGVNAFFVRDDLCADHFEEPFTSEHHFEPPRYFLIHREGHPPGFSDERRAP